MKKIISFLSDFEINITVSEDYLSKSFKTDEPHLHFKDALQHHYAYPENYPVQLNPGSKVAALNESQYCFLKSLYAIIEDNLDSSMQVDFLAKKMALSKSTLNRRLSNILGMSANELIRQYRLKKAATYLISGKNVTEAAYLTGFETASYFTQCFKEFYNVTPKIYSKTILQLLMDQSTSHGIAV